VIELLEQLKRLNEKKEEELRSSHESLAKKLNISRKEYNNDINSILAFYGITEDFDISLEDAKDKYDISTRSVILEDEWYKWLVLPTLAETKKGFVAVIPSINGKAFFYESGKKKYITSKNADAFLKNGICLYKGAGNIRSIPEFLKYLFSTVTAGEKLLIFLLNFLTLAVGLAFPAINYAIFNYIIPSAGFSDIFPIGCILFSVSGITFVTGILQSSYLIRALMKIEVYAQAALFSKLLKAKTEFFKELKSGELSDSILGFINSTVSAASFSTLISLLLLFVYLIQIYYFAGKLIYTVFGITIVLILLIGIELASRMKWRKSYSKSSADMTGFVYEFFCGMEKIKLNGAELRMFKKWSKKYSDYAKIRIKPFFVKYSSVFYKIFSITATIAIFLNATSSGSAQYIAFYSAYGAFIAILLRVPAMVEAITAFTSALTLVAPLISVESEPSEGKKISFDDGDIELSKIFFKYTAEGSYIINNLNLTIKNGECLGIAGASGCGKSTLIRIILGFESNYEGNIFIGKTSFREIKDWRKNIGTVLQDSRLISGTIYSNITLTKSNASPAEVNNAIILAGLKDDIEKMPMGLHTLISEENCNISGGQKQRILIARAILKEPKLLIFDEATSALDNMVQAAVSESINNIECTKIIIAHRLATLKNCDRIIVIENGTIVEEGKYDELISQSTSAFSKLTSRQVL